MLPLYKNKGSASKILCPEIAWNSIEKSFIHGLAWGSKSGVASDKSSPKLPKPRLTASAEAVSSDTSPAPKS